MTKRKEGTDVYVGDRQSLASGLWQILSVRVSRITMSRFKRHGVIVFQSLRKMGEDCASYIPAPGFGQLAYR